MHFSFEFVLLVALELKWKFSYFSHFSVVGRGGTLTALTQHVSRRMEDLRLWHELSCIKVQYASWDWDVRLSLKSYDELKAVFHKKSAWGPMLQFSSTEGECFAPF